LETSCKIGEEKRQRVVETKRGRIRDDCREVRVRRGKTDLNKGRQGLGARRRGDKGGGLGGGKKSEERGLWVV